MGPVRVLNGFELVQYLQALQGFMDCGADLQDFFELDLASPIIYKIVLSFDRLES